MNISELPPIHKEEKKLESYDFQAPLKNIPTIFALMVSKGQKNIESGDEVIIKATEYNIPFNLKELDWQDLADKVNEYEILLEKADEINLAWDMEGYDPVALEQMIEHTIECDEAEERKHSNEERQDYYASQGLEY